MFNRLALAALLTACSAASAHAQVGDLNWRIEADGSLVLLNPTDQAIGFDGYTIACEAGCLDPDGWRSIGDAVAADALAVIIGLGSGALATGEAGTPNGFQLSELNLGGQAVLQPGAEWSFGRPLAGTLSEIGEWICDGVVSITMSGAGSVVEQPFDTLFCIPEPGSACLASMAAFGLAAVGLRRRRSHDSRVTR